MRGKVKLGHSFRVESLRLAEEAYSRGYGLACYLHSQGVLTMPGMFSLEIDPNCFSDTLTLKQVREYSELSKMVLDFNNFWRS